MQGGNVLASTTFTDALGITSVSPTSGSTLGGTSVTITGTSFTTGQAPFAVTFGGVSATNVTRVDNTHLTCTTPAHAAGTVDVIVQDKNGTATLTNGFTYNKFNTTTAVSSNHNPSVWGQSVTFTANVAVVSPGAGTPDGTVQFKVDGVDFGSAVALVSGSASSSATTTLSVATHTVSAVYSGSTNYNTSTGDLSGGQVVNKRPTTSSVTVTPNSSQYSDLVTFTATLSPASVNGYAPATSVTFKVGTQVMGTVNLTDNGSGILTASLENVPLLEPTPFGTSPTGQMAPGSHTVTAGFNGIDSTHFIVTNPTTSLTITTEDARVTYSGALFVSTSSATSTSATVTLRATIQDITAVTGDAAYDVFAGDIQNATVQFIVVEAGKTSPVLPVALLMTDTKVGTAAWDVILSVDSTGSSQYTVRTIVNNYYTRDSQTDNSIVTVSQPLSNFITGGGYLVLQNSSGQYPGSAGTKMNFGFNVKFNKNLTNLQGHVNIIIRNGGKTYQIKSTATDSLVVNVTKGTAMFTSKCTITDITNPLSPIGLAGGVPLQISMTDKGEPGKDDTFAVTVWDKSNKLLFSSSWIGGKTVEQTLGGGNLQVH